MVKIPPFDVEQWMDAYENTPNILNVAETCCASISLSELEAFNATASHSPINPRARLTYGAIRGSDALRGHIAERYQGAVAPENVIVTQGAISANYLIFYSLVGPGDHVICVYPTYQQLYAVPESLGAEVTLWRLREERGYVPDVEELEGLVKETTRMIIINNPNNPTGAVTSRATLEQIVSVAKKHNIILFSDEVYHPLFHSVPENQQPPSVIALGYERSVVTSSMSKAWALAGTRIGWVASRDCDLIEIIAAARDYTTISVSQIDDQVASYALSSNVAPSLLYRNLQLARTNLSLLEQFVNKYIDTGKVRWTKPTAGTTAWVQFWGRNGKPVDDVQFCQDVLEQTGVFFLPGSKCFGHGRDEEFRGFVRIGYVNETEVLREALNRLVGFVDGI